jgi:hypothetical protein
LKNLNLQCRCSEVALRVTGEPVVQLYCHCDDCRAAHGAAYVAAVIYPETAVKITRGTPTPIVVRTNKRFRCEACGTHMFSEIEAVGLRSVNAFLFPKGEFQPQAHVQCQHAVLPVKDSLPHYKGFPAAAGGSDECVDW